MPTRTFTELDSPSPGGDGVGHRAATMIDDRKDAIASGIESAAASIRDRAEELPGGERIVRAAEVAADAMDSAADYVREQDLRDMLTDVRQIVTRHPGATLLAAAALGFVLARSLSRH